MRCGDDLLILKDVGLHKEVGKVSLNPLRGGMIRMDWVDKATLDLEDVYYPAGHRVVLCVRFSTDPFTEYSNEAIWGMVELVKVMRKERSVVMNDRRLFVNKTQLCVGESQYTVQCSNNEHSE